MTERKPKSMSFESWIDRQIRDADERGLFDDLPGKGKPLNIKPTAGDGDFGQAWARDYALREGVPPEEFLPTPLRLRREIERLADVVPDMRSEQEVRDAVSDINRRVLQWRKIPVGPPVHVRLVNKDEMLTLWRTAQKDHAARAARATQPGDRPGSRAGGSGSRRRRALWLPWRKR
ncbi:MAG TPA: DUF1992 domain-containing protein [Trebonia sp.]